ncbi:helix-turn-helix domain-containing protein [Gordonia caeni]|uniref:Helix-turn-helix domain-containing protein n=1 Tax=Gordonia caeni TaxID=1007097 RepID=A0ABP7NI08_9ACTN
MELRDVRRLNGTTITPYRILGATPGTHLGLPSPTTTLVIDLGTGLVLSTRESEPRTFRVSVGGMHLAPVTVHHDGTQVGVFLSLSPGAVRALFGVRPGDVCAQNFELADMAPRLARRLYDELGAVAPDRRGDVCARVIDERLGAAGTPPADPDAQRAWQLLGAARGRLTVSRLVELSGWSARKLTALFTAEYGVGPKQAARLFRFDHARRRLDAGEPIAEIATACGYSDQAHLTREFTAFTGLPPRSLLTARANEFAGAAAP